MSCCWAVWFIFGSVFGALQPALYIVENVIREKNEVFCMGGIVSSRTVLTACSCIGRFLFDEKKTFYFFDQYDPRNTVIKTATGETFEIEMSIVNGHCMPSDWDKESLENNLGGWKIENSFDLALNGVLLPFDQDNRLHMFAVENEYVDCYFLAFDPMVNMIQYSYLKVPKDQTSCTHYLCGVFSKSRTIDCTLLEGTVVMGANKCSTIDRRMEGSVGTGSPVFCQVHNEFHILGVVTELAVQNVLVTRLDIEPNTAFYRKVYSGRNVAGRLQVSGVALLLAVKSPI